MKNDNLCKAFALAGAAICGVAGSVIGLGITAFVPVETIATASTNTYIQTALLVGTSSVILNSCMIGSAFAGHGVGSMIGRQVKRVVVANDRRRENERRRVGTFTP